MKKMIVLLFVLALTFAMVIPAAASGKGPGDGTGSGIGTCTGTGIGAGTGTCTGTGFSLAQKGSRGMFAITGTIASIGTDTVTIDVLRGNKLVQPFLGTPITVTVTLSTRYLYKDGTTVATIGLADLLVGQSVSLNGSVADGTWTAARITVGASLSCLP